MVERLTLPFQPPHGITGDAYRHNGLCKSIVTLSYLFRTIYNKGINTTLLIFNYN